MTKPRAQTCSLCTQSEGSEAVFEGQLYRCQSCGFSWTAHPERVVQDDLFDAGYYNQYFARANQWRYEAGRRLRWLLSATRPRSIVEAGSAGGFFLEQARRAGIQVEGVEPSEVCVRFAREESGLPVRQGTFETSLPESPVDAVCAFHVLEHVEDPHAFLSAARRALVPGGWLALEVPNIASRSAARQGSSWHALQPAFHRWHFSPQSLLRLVKDHGFNTRHNDTVSARYYMRPSHWIRPRGLLTLLDDCAVSGYPRIVTRQHGDYLRLLAQLPESQALS
ncbi:class I SAM-dependent methyltransferase [Saccharopolyspora mangrovi]|uniref:Class I SAM-dependent methyltransferase n=1 Tax=Saccharopolyspora mangrovi TaxID=3082379 RepID=A0ABU6AET8_9PSEU|nr:class I SAM-dependent methyltransferase [Saccharopolyspora sp. S2-29]MEB3369993.1 class I SAM-dependent methyltransferase [Saccharopolyspora sp. S2-29]